MTLQHFDLSKLFFFFFVLKYVLDGLITFDGEGGARNFFLIKATIITHAITKKFINFFFIMISLQVDK